MKCREAQERLVELLDAGVEGSGPAELAAHVRTCPACSQQYEEARHTLAFLKPSHDVKASPFLKERIMNAVADTQSLKHTAAARPWAARRWLPAAAAVAAVLLAAVVITSLTGRTPSTGGAPTARSLLAQASAAEDRLFRAGPGKVAHVTNEIVVPPLADAALAGARWWPVLTLDAAGQPHFGQLKLGAAPGEGYTATDESWYDPATGRFARIIRAGQAVLFAHSFDGREVRSLRVAESGAPEVVCDAVTQDFTPPRKASELLGIAVGFASTVTAGADGTEMVGAGALADGTPVSVVRLETPGMENAAVLARIRSDDSTLAEIELQVDGRTMLLARRAASEAVAEQAAPWDLAGVLAEAARTPAPAGTGISADMVVPDVTLQHMVERADFETYAFSPGPSWAGERRIADVLDVASPPHRMFIVVHKAADGRHVVLVQSYSYNQMLGGFLRGAQVIYESPNGFKVYTGPRDEWLARLLLSSARAATGEVPGAQVTGYALGSPKGTYPCLAVNGALTEQELHALVDSLVPARDLAGD